MMPRTPAGDLVAALVLFGATTLLVYVSVHDGRLGIIDREEHPIGFWTCTVGVGLLMTGVAALIAWEASAMLLGG